MRHLLSALLVSVLAQPAAAEPAPRAIDLFVNLVLGECMADKGGKALLADPVDPGAVGVPVAADNPDPRLGPDTVRIPSTDGAVYHDRDAETCHVYGDGIDAERAVTRIQEALKAAEVPVMPFSDVVEADSAGVRQRSAIYGVMISPRAETLPVVTLRYPVDTPAAVSAGVRAGRFE